MNIEVRVRQRSRDLDFRRETTRAGVENPQIPKFGEYLGLLIYVFFGKYARGGPFRGFRAGSPPRKPANWRALQFWDTLLVGVNSPTRVPAFLPDLHQKCTVSHQKYRPEVFFGVKCTHFGFFAYAT